MPHGRPLNGPATGFVPGRRTASRESLDVRRAKSKDSTATEDSLYLLARDPDVVVRRSVAVNRNAPPKALRRLARDRDVLTRWRVAAHPATPEVVLRVLTRDKDRDVRVWAARNPHLSADTLRILAGSRDPAVRISVAHNPATPLPILATLIEDGDDEVERAIIGNWVGDYYHGGGISDLRRRVFALAHHPDARKRLVAASSSTTPPETLAALATDQDSGVRVAALWALGSVEARSILARDPSPGLRWRVAHEADVSDLPDGLLSALANDEYCDVRFGLATNDSTPSWVLVQLAHDGGHGPRLGVTGSSLDAQVRIEVAGNRNTALDTLSVLARDPEWIVRFSVAYGPNVSAEMLASLAQDRKSDVRWAVATRLHTPARVLAALAKDPDREVQGALSYNPSVPAATLAALADRWIEESGWGEALGFLAGNPSTPAATLDKLATLDGWWIRAAVAGNPSTSVATRVEALVALSRAWHDGSRVEAAKNPDTPPDVLKSLTADRSPKVREAAWTNPATPLTDLIQHAIRTLSISGMEIARMERLGELTPSEQLAVSNKLTAIGEDPKTAPDVLVALAEIPHSGVRIAVASNPNTPPHTLLGLALAESPMGVPDAVASNPSTPYWVLERLASDATPRWRVLAAIDENPSTPAHLGPSARVAEAEDPRTSPSRLSALAQDPNRIVIRAVAANPNTPSDALRSLARLEPYGVALNPNTSSETLADLSRDENLFIPKASG